MLRTLLSLTSVGLVTALSAVHAQPLPEYFEGQFVAGPAQGDAYVLFHSKVVDGIQQNFAMLVLDDWQKHGTLGALFRVEILQGGSLSLIPFVQTRGLIVALDPSRRAAYTGDIRDGDRLNLTSTGLYRTGMGSHIKDGFPGTLKATLSGYRSWLQIPERGFELERCSEIDGEFSLTQAVGPKAGVLAGHYPIGKSKFSGTLVFREIFGDMANLRATVVNSKTGLGYDLERRAEGAMAIVQTSPAIGANNRWAYVFSLEPGKVGFQSVSRLKED